MRDGSPVRQVADAQRALMADNSVGKVYRRHLEKASGGFVIGFCG